MESAFKTSEKISLKSVLTTAILVLSFVALVLSNVVNPLAISLPLTLIMSVGLVGLILIVFILNANKIPYKLGLLYVSVIACYFAVYLIHGTGLEYFVNIVILLGFLVVLPYLDGSNKVIKILPYAFLVFNLLIILFAPRTTDEMMGNLISLNNINPNGSSFILLFSFVFTLKMLSGTKSFHLKCLLLILLFIVFYCQWQFASRISSLGAILYFIYFLLRKLIDKIGKNAVIVILIVVLLLSPVVCYFYSITLFNLIGKGNLEVMGKDIFTGRQVIWSEAFESIKNNWFIGIGNTFKSSWIVNGVDDVATNLHNQMMGCLVCFGVVNMILFAVVYSVSVGKHWQNTQFKLAMALLILLSVMSYTDTIFYSSYNVYTIVFGITMLCLKKQEKNNDKKDSLRLDRE